MTDTLRALLERLSREPVLFFGFVGLAITAWLPDLVDTDPEKAAVAAGLLFLQRAFSTSKRTAAENIETARYVGAVEGEARTPTTIVNNVTAKRAPARKATAKRPPH